MSDAQSFRVHAGRVLMLGLPLAGSHLAQFAIQLTDTIMLGRYDVEALAAQVLAGTLFFVLFIMGSGFAWAVMPVVAAAAGSGETAQVRRVTRMSLWLSLATGALCLPFFLLADPILRAIGQERDLARLAAGYLTVQGWSIFPALTVMVLKSYLSALERTQVVLWTTLAAVIVNAAMNYALIFGNWGAPELGIVGAAWASLVSTLASMLGLALYAVRVLPEHALFSNFLSPDRAALARVFRLGWPIGLTSLAEVGLFAAASVMMGWLGTLPLAAHGIALQIVSVMFMVHLGLSNAATVRAGNALGRRDGPELRRGAVVVLAMSAGVAVATVALLLGIPEPLMGLFLEADDPARVAVLRLGTSLLAAAALFQLVDAAQVMALGLLRGVQDTRIPMILAGVSYWLIGVPAAWIMAFPLGLGGVGLWLGLAAGLGVAAITMTWRFWRLGAYAVENGSTG